MAGPPRHAAPVGHSRDGQWWSDGTGWHPALTPDRAAWFDGRTWVSARYRPLPPRVRGLAWLTGLVLLLALPGSLLVHEAVSADVSDTAAGIGLVGGGAVGLLLLVVGGHLLTTHHRAGRIGVAWLLATVVVVTSCALTFLVAGATGALTSRDLQAEELGQLAVGAATVVLLALLLGAGTGALVRASRSGRGGVPVPPPAPPAPARVVPAPVTPVAAPAPNRPSAYPVTGAVPQPPVPHQPAPQQAPPPPDGEVHRFWP